MARHNAITVTSLPHESAFDSDKSYLSRLLGTQFRSPGADGILSWRLSAGPSQGSSKWHNVRRVGSASALCGDVSRRVK